MLCRGELPTRKSFILLLKSARLRMTMESIDDHISRWLLVPALPHVAPWGLRIALRAVRRNTQRRLSGHTVRCEDPWCNI